MSTKQFGIVTLLLSAMLFTTAAAAQMPQVVDVWPGKVPGEKGDVGEEQFLDPRPNEKKKVQRLTNVSKPTLTLYPAPKDNNTGAAVVICPGGGYSILAWDLEGVEVAKWLNSIGVTGVLLKYRVPRRKDQPRDKPPIGPLQDAQRALSLVRAKAKEWDIDPNRIGILGFSAGGHLSAHASTNYDKRAYAAVDEIDRVGCRPDFAVLIYPAYLVKRGTMTLSPEIRVTKRTPPTFFAHAANDPIKPENSIAMFLALKEAGVTTELHVYSTGGHGYGLRPSEHAVTSWPQRCEAWLRGRELLKKR